MLSGKVYDLLSIHCRQRCAFASLYLKSTIRSLVLLMLSKLSLHNPVRLLISSGYEFTILFEIWHNRILSLSREPSPGGLQYWVEEILLPIQTLWSLLGNLISGWKTLTPKKLGQCVECKLIHNNEYMGCLPCSSVDRALVPCMEALFSLL